MRIMCGVAAVAGFGVVLGFGFVVGILVYGGDPVMAWLWDH